MLQNKEIPELHCLCNLNETLFYVSFYGPPKLYSRPLESSDTYSPIAIVSAIWGFLLFRTALSVVSMTENSVSLYVSSHYLTMGSECRRDVTEDNSLSKEFVAPLVQQGAPVFVHQRAPAN